MADDVVDIDGKKALGAGNKFKKATLKRLDPSESGRRFRVFRNRLHSRPPLCGQSIRQNVQGENSGVQRRHRPADARGSERESGREYPGIASSREELMRSAPCSAIHAAKDSNESVDDALIELYRKLRPGDPPTLESARKLFIGLCFDPAKYDFSRSWSPQAQYPPRSENFVGREGTYDRGFCHYVEVPIEASSRYRSN
ncbi:MAG: hypothetical protein MZV49_04680 [Rhodopseudomonas palustris]|nr:hypothetical protein [Rhodopseudomonas palustris]